MNTTTVEPCQLSSDEWRLLQSAMPHLSESELSRVHQLLTGTPMGTRTAMPQSPMELAAITWGPNLKTAKHLELLDKVLVEAAKTPGKRIMVTMPPRHGKSMLCSEHFPAWYLGTFPDNRIILASYEADFASQWGRKARNILTEHGGPQFGIAVSNDSSAADRWDINGHRGGMQTAGVGGAITGKGANLLIVDDPVKNAEQANSYIYRQKAWDWWQSVAYTRLEPGASAVLIQTRWHEDDLAGRLLKEATIGGEQWECINFPAVAESNDAIGRQPGEALWAERYDAQQLAGIRRNVGEYVWQALYQQNPKGAEGNKVKRDWFKRYTKIDEYYRIDGKPAFQENECERFITCDCAATSEDVAKERKGRPPSRSVISIWDYYRPKGYLMWLDCDYGYWEFNELLARAIAAIDRFTPAWFGAEDEKTGKALLSMLRPRRVRSLSHENKDKLTNFAPALNELEQGNVWLPMSTTQSPWRVEAENEITAWDGHPDTPFDFGDTLGQAVKQSLAKEHGQGAWGGPLSRSRAGVFGAGRR